MSEGDEGAAGIAPALSTALVLQILEHAPAAIYVKDAEGRFLFVNAASAAILGARREEVPGRTDHAFMDAEFADRMRAHDRAVLGSGEATEAEETIPGPDGQPRTFISLKFPLRADDGTPVAVCGISTEITAQKGAEQALRQGKARLRATFENAAVGIVEVDEEDRFIAVNDRICEILGYRKDELLGKRVDDVTAPEDRDRSRAVNASMHRREHDRFSYEKRYLRKDGSRLWVHVTIAAFWSEAGQYRAIGTVEDITARRAAEAERERAMDALRAANEKLRDADRRKDEFLGMLSHELRNPLAPVRNSLYILDRADPAGAQARRAREVANRQVAHLTRLVDDLLDVTRIARGKVELRRQELDVGALARRAADDHRTLMVDREVELVVDVPAHPVLVSGDETRLAQVLGNLLSNAAKFTSAGGRVTLAVAASDGLATIRVRDTGAGIEPHLLEAVFEPFTQAEQTLARSEGGLGLGLALVKGLVALHGGEVTASSAGRGRGTEFAIVLPTVRAAASEPRDGGAPRLRCGVRRRVLVVDDNRDAAETLAELVELFGHDVEVAFDGPSAVAKARARPPDVVLCDIGLPGMSGYEVAQELRVGAPSTLRLVAVSGYAAPEDLARAADAGFDGHVAKPADPERIHQLLC